MWKPDESLDDYIVKPATGLTSDPPRAVSLRLTAEIEILTPLTRREIGTTTVETSRSTAPYQPLWFRRFVAVGSGCLVVIAFVLVSAIIIGTSDPASNPGVAINGLPDNEQTKEPIIFDIFSPSSIAPVNGGIDSVRSNIRRRPARPSLHRASYKPKRQSRPSLQPAEPKFFPTTLIIYAENGVINTRIEPWLQAAYKKPPTLSY
ncbi:MAG: hypothetical protein ABI646_03515 [Acidobacteriota bacterium]